jgi:hypothetical protein
VRRTKVATWCAFFTKAFCLWEWYTTGQLYTCRLMFSQRGEDKTTQLKSKICWNLVFCWVPKNGLDHSTFESLQYICPLQTLADFRTWFVHRMGLSSQFWESHGCCMWVCRHEMFWVPHFQIKPCCCLDNFVLCTHIEFPSKVSSSLACYKQPNLCATTRICMNHYCHQQLTTHEALQLI